MHMSSYVCGLVALLTGLAFLFVNVQCVLAILDGYNAYTVPLFAWRAVLSIKFAAMSLGFLLAMVVFVCHKEKRDYAKERSAARESTSGEKTRLNGTPVEPQQDKTARMAQDYMCSVNTSAKRYAFFGVMWVFAVWHLMQILFIYQYTKDEPGYQTALDKGFPTDKPMLFAVEKKMLLLYSIQLELLAAWFVFIIGSATGRVARHHHSA